ncbi:hypothetical protein Gotri_025643 [Gossypium trilobum]|uniref:DUF4283 domain-containing protein n=1 Tax=Gossypium trilobum TaxID=34281 RepID=A0A7J9FS45_9ROSI|nr:hypothetical protein [Gossypium trilobum]
MSDYNFHLPPFWIQIYDIPFEQMDRQVVVDIGSVLGEFLPLIGGTRMAIGFSTYKFGMKGSLYFVIIAVALDTILKNSWVRWLIKRDKVEILTENDGTKSMDDATEGRDGELDLSLEIAKGKGKMDEGASDSSSLTDKRTKRDPKGGIRARSKHKKNQRV